MSKKDALAQEASREPITFEYDGETYTVPPPKLWPLEVLDEQEAGRMNGATAALLGKEQWAKFREKPRTVEDLDGLTATMFEGVNTSLGESDA